MAGEQAVMNDQQRLMKELNVIQNILGITLIEIEQINPRIRQLQGAMTVKYHGTGGSIDDPESVLQYEYDWIGGEIAFIENPFPRVPLGTGRIARIADDESDPSGKAVRVPAGAMSGHEYGWNRELLASHYGEGYWRIVDPEIDMQIRDRYRSILYNKMANSAGFDKLKPEEIDAELDKQIKAAVAKQQKAGAGTQRVEVTRISSAPIVSQKAIRKDIQAQAQPDEEKDALKQENKELRDMIAKLNERMNKQDAAKTRMANARAAKKTSEAKADGAAKGNLGG